jgi:predicted nucleic acid-binding protein
VISEAAAGDVQASLRRLAMIEGLFVIDVTPLAEDLADHILRRAGLPVRARADALHIALAASQGLDYLMTWNATHLANALIRPRVERACRLFGYEPPVLCTPDELIAGEELDV